jgi:hypothetical protein
MLLRRALGIVVSTGLAVISFSIGAFAIGFQPVSPDELKMTSEPQAPGAAAVVLFRQVDRDDNGRTSHEDNYLRIKILKEEGRKYADVEIPFFKAEGNIANIHARTIRPDGSIANFDGKVFDKSIAKRKGYKYLAKTFTLPDVEVGGIIEYFYTIDLSENLIYDSHWILSDELFTKHAQFSLKPYRGTYQTFGLRWNWNFLPPKTEPPKQGPDSIIRMQADNIPAFVTEDFMPPENEVKGRVNFIYSEDTFEPDLDKFWKKASKKWNDHLEGFVNKRKPMEQALSQIVATGDSPEVKLQKIYAKVQQMRNTSYEVRKTEQEEKRDKEKEPENVEEVWKRGYASGTNLTWLFLGLARAAGFEANGVWVSERRNYFFDPKIMDSSKLDANVVLVKVNGKDAYFDPGAQFTPYGVLPWDETGVVGRKLDKDGGSWIQTSMPESAVSQTDRKANFKLNPDTGGLEGKLSITYTGLEASRRRVDERNQDETERKKMLEDEVRECVPAAIDIDLINKPEWNSSSLPLVAEFDVKIPGWASSTGHRALVPVGIFSANEKHVFDHAERVHPIYFEFQNRKVDDVNIELPTGWKVATLPKAQDQSQHVIGYTLKVENDKDKIHLSRTLSLDILLMESKYYAALRAFFQGVRTGDDEQIVLQPGTENASK